MNVIMSVKGVWFNDRTQTKVCRGLNWTDRTEVSEERKKEETRNSGAEQRKGLSWARWP